MRECLSVRVRARVRACVRVCRSLFVGTWIQTHTREVGTWQNMGTFLSPHKNVPISWHITITTRDFWGLQLSPHKLVWKIHILRPHKWVKFFLWETRLTITCLRSINLLEIPQCQDPQHEKNNNRIHFIFLLKGYTQVTYKTIKKHPYKYLNLTKL